ncbi:MAG: glycoside hydrolase family 3 protein, partial [Lachnospiraceae bacterium]|nr:glycoside hydrolase family 3 protein [Lachnospiraceae bacterium]
HSLIPVFWPMFETADSYMIGEPPADFYTQDVLNAAKDTTAVVFLSRDSSEASDYAVSTMKDPNGDNFERPMALSDNEKAMLELAKKNSNGKVIVVLNSDVTMEIAELKNDPAINAIVWAGLPGAQGFRGVADVLAGDVNPSGHISDTYAVNSISAPAMQNFGLFFYTNEGIDPGNDKGNWYIVETEGIYVGYKYYETRYADAVMGDAGAASAVGSSFDGGWEYAREMCYPFGYGLSYTDFSEQITDVRKGRDHTYTVTVRVQNTGSTAGKRSVQLYASTPYGDYEKARKIEKSAIQLVGFGKTGVLQPGASEDLVITVDEYLFASYDYTDTKGYVLTAGDYYFSVGSDAHAALNHVLGAKGYANLTDIEGKPFAADPKCVYQWSMDLDTTTYRYGENAEETGVVVTNLFDKMDINAWEGNSVKYLTRSDWAGTFPTEPAKAYLLGTEMETLLQGDFYAKTSETPSTDIYAQGKGNGWKGTDNGLSFVNMRKVDYDDEETWNRFLDQFTLDDLVLMTANYFGNKSITTQPINIPQKSGGDGCQGVGDEPYSETLTGGAVLWPCLYTSLLSCTFNPALMAERGKLMANQALFLNQTVIWTGGGNLHRTPFGGRQAEYYSEDANLCYLISVIELSEMEKRGILAGIKHFAANDQESHREGLVTFFNEQAHREGALRGFEGAVRVAKVHAIMQSFNRQGVVFSSACEELNVGVLRDEWGFEGEVITDASSGTTTGYKSHYVTTMAMGTDIYCLDGDGVGGTIVANYIKDNDDGFILGCMRRAAKNTAFALSRSMAVNGLSDDTVIRTIVPAWQIIAYTVMGVLVALAVLSMVMLAITGIRNARAGKEAGHEGN